MIPTASEFSRPPSSSAIRITVPCPTTGCKWTASRGGHTASSVFHPWTARHFSFAFPLPQILVAISFTRISDFLHLKRPHRCQSSGSGRRQPLWRRQRQTDLGRGPDGSRKRTESINAPAFRVNMRWQVLVFERWRYPRPMGWNSRHRQLSLPCKRRCQRLGWLWLRSVQLADRRRDQR